MKQTCLIIVAAVIALGLGIVVRSHFPPAKKISPSVLPDFNLLDLSGHQHNMSEWRGKVLVINFWASWCTPCRKEIPNFIALQGQYAAQGLQFIGIALESKEEAAAYVASSNINYPILLGGDQGIALAQQLGNPVNTIPYSLVVDKQGRVIHQHPGEFSKGQIMAAIMPLLD